MHLLTLLTSKQMPWPLKVPTEVSSSVFNGEWQIDTVEDFLE